MLTRHPVLLTFSVPLRYPSRPVTSRTNKAASILRALFQIPHPVSRLPATLMDLPASVANKRLIAGLNPLDATLTKNRGYILQANYLSLSSLSPAHSEVQPRGTRHSQLFIRHYPLATGLKFFLFTPLRTLLHQRKTQLFCFQAIPHSLQKTTRGGGACHHFSVPRLANLCALGASAFPFSTRHLGACPERVGAGDSSPSFSF